MQGAGGAAIACSHKHSPHLTPLTHTHLDTRSHVSLHPHTPLHSHTSLHLTLTPHAPLLTHTYTPLCTLAHTLSPTGAYTQSKLATDGSLVVGSFLFVFIYLSFTTGSFFLGSFGMVMIFANFAPAILLYRIIFGYSYFGTLNMLAGAVLTHGPTSQSLLHAFPPPRLSLTIASLHSLVCNSCGCFAFCVRRRHLGSLYCAWNWSTCAHPSLAPQPPYPSHHTPHAIVALCAQVDDIFVLLDTWKATAVTAPQGAGVAERMSATLRHAGKAMATTSFSTIFAFVANATSRYTQCPQPSQLTHTQTHSLTPTHSHPFIVTHALTSLTSLTTAPPITRLATPLSQLPCSVHLWHLLCHARAVQLYLRLPLLSQRHCCLRPLPQALPPLLLWPQARACEATKAWLNLRRGWRWCRRWSWGGSWWR